MFLQKKSLAHALVNTNKSSIKKRVRATSTTIILIAILCQDYFFMDDIQIYSSFKAINNNGLT